MADRVRRQRIGGANGAVHLPASTHPALLRDGIHFNQAEPQIPTLRPFEVVGQRPVIVALHRKAILNCPPDLTGVFHRKGGKELVLCVGWLGGAPRNERQPQSTFPPGKRDLLLTLRVLDNLFRGHAAASRALRRQLPRVAPTMNGTTEGRLHVLQSRAREQAVSGCRRHVLFFAYGCS
jgi:hypothetical protein